MEHYADGLVGEAEREAARAFAQELDDGSEYARWMREALIGIASSNVVVEHVWSHLFDFTDSQGFPERELNQVGSQILHDLIGNPFRPTVLDSVVMGPGVTDLAGTVYDGRFWDCMPALADAIELAGCANHDVLTHCRHSGQHVRGCWVVDPILRKEAPH